MLRIDIVVPVRNESANVPRLVASLESLPLVDVDWRVLFVEDGSRDDTRAVLRAAAQRNPRVRYFAMQRGFGEGPAVVFGVSKSDADAVVTMGADGSHPPARIPELVAGFREGADVVQCIRRSLPGRPWWRDAGTTAFGWLTRALTGESFARQNVYFRLMSREVADRLLGEPLYWRFLRIPLPDPTSGKLRFIETEMAERSQGRSAYSPARLVGVALDGLISLVPPLRLAVLCGVGAGAALGCAGFGAPVAAGVIALATGGVLVRRLQLGRADYLARFVVVESSDDGIDRRS